MAAYVIVDMTVTDPVGIEEYRKLAGASVEIAGSDAADIDEFRLAHHLGIA